MQGKKVFSLGNLGAAIMEAAFPRICLACGQSPVLPDPFCPECLAQIKMITGSLRPRSGHPRPKSRSNDFCSGRLLEQPAFEWARSLALHQGPLADAVRDFKYRRRWVAGAELARFAARRTPAAWLQEADLIAPVPLHPWRLISRGFNQALVLAKALAREHGLKLAPRLLIRRRHTRPQVGLGIQERRKNVAGAFSVRGPEKQRISGQRILLFDDVYTTGATVEQCAMVLKSAGAAAVQVLTLVRAGESDKSNS